MVYILGLKCNLLSIGQFLESNYKIHMENRVLKVMDENGCLILMGCMAQHRTFKVELKVIVHRSLSTITRREECIRNYWLGHLNFKDLNAMWKNNVVVRLPLINMSTEACEECVQTKQHQGSFSKDA